MKRFVFAIVFSLTALLPRASFAAGSPSSCSAPTLNEYYCTCSMSTATGPIYATATSTESCNTACAAYTDAAAWTFEQCSNSGGSLHVQRLGMGSVTATPSTGAQTSTTSTPPKADPLFPNLNVDIPGLNKSEFSVTNSGGSVKSNFLGVYIEAVYSWLIGAAALIAVTMMMIGGLQYAMARGKAAYIDKAKKRMTNAITGLILLLAAYDIAFLINPDLVVFHALEPRYVDAIAYVAESGDSSGDVSIGSPPEDVVCDSSSSIYEIATSMAGNVTYRLGGKGGDAPFRAESKKDSKGVSYSSYCPDGQLCLDCSGFVSYVAKCKGLSSAGESGGTAGIFSGSAAEKVVSCNAQAINGVNLQAGDLIGWPTVGDEYGHVFMYIGDGYIMDSRGGIGREPGRAVTKKSTTFACDNYMDTDHGLYVRRRSQ